MKTGRSISKILAIALVLIMIWVVFPFGAVPPENQALAQAPRTWYVDDDLHDYPDADCSRIGDALATAMAGDTIIVYGGTFYENLVLNKRIFLKGIGYPVIDGRRTNVITITADGCSIQGFKLVNGGHHPGWPAAGIWVKSNNNIIESNIIEKNRFGIELSDSNYNVIKGNTIRSNDNDGISLGLSLSEGSHYNEISGNDIYSNGEYGVCLHDSSNNKIIGNNVFGNGYVYNGIGFYLAVSPNNLIYLNNFAYHPEYNVYPRFAAGNSWSSPERIAYTYCGKTYVNYLGNYWDDYTGSDAGGDGIGDTPYPIVGSDADNYPLVEPFEDYLIVQDTTPPSVSSVSPGDGCTAVSVQAVVTTTFSEDVRQGDNFGQISLKDASGQSVVVTKSIDGGVLTIKPSAKFAYSTTYMVTIPAGAVQDLASNPLAQPYSFRFATEAPPSKVDITFSEFLQSLFRTPFKGRIVGITFDSDAQHYAAGASLRVSVEIDRIETQRGPYFVYLYLLDPAGKTVYKTQTQDDIWIEEGRNTRVLEFPYTIPHGAIAGKYHVVAKLVVSLAKLVDIPVHYSGLDDEVAPPEAYFTVEGDPSDSPPYEEGGGYRELRKEVEDSLITLFPVYTKMHSPIEDPGTEANFVLAIDPLKETPILTQYKRVTVRVPLTQDAQSAIESVDGEKPAIHLSAILPSSRAGCLETYIQRELSQWVFDFRERSIEEVVQWVISKGCEVILGECIAGMLSIVGKIHDVAYSPYETQIKETMTPDDALEVYLPIGVEMTIETEGQSASFLGTSALSTAAVLMSVTGKWTGTITEDLDRIEIPLRLDQKGWDTFDILHDLLVSLTDEDYQHIQQIKLACPSELRVYDSQHRLTGLINAEVRTEIPKSIFSEDNMVVTILNCIDTYSYQIIGTHEETYDLMAAFVEGDSVAYLSAQRISISANATHQYTIDWDALSQGEKGVTIQMDSDGDGDFEETVITSQPNTPSSPSPVSRATGVDIDADLTWVGADLDAGDTVTYDVYFGTNSTPSLKTTVGPYPAAQSAIAYDPGTLVDGTKYYWKIVARDNHGIAREGPLWDFTAGQPHQTVPWNLSYGLGADPAAVNIWTYPADAVPVTLADVDWSMPSGLLIWYYGGPTQGWRFYKKGWGSVNTLETLIPGKGYISIVPTAGVWEIPQ